MKEFVPEKLECHECGATEFTRKYEDCNLDWAEFCKHQFCSVDCAVRWTLKNKKNTMEAESAVGLRT